MVANSMAEEEVIFLSVTVSRRMPNASQSVNLAAAGKKYNPTSEWATTPHFNPYFT